jgi:hypothetical protein
LIIVSGNGKLLVMTSEFDVVYETNVDDGDLTFDGNSNVKD